MVENLEGRHRRRSGPALASRVLAWLDLILGVSALGAALGFLVRLFRDPLGFGLLFALALLPYGVIALAAWQTMRSRDRGRVVLQTLTLLPFVLIGVLLLRR